MASAVATALGNPTGNSGFVSVCVCGGGGGGGVVSLCVF